MPEVITTKPLRTTKQPPPPPPLPSHHFILLLFFACVLLTSAAPAGVCARDRVVINEVMASNAATIADGDGDYEDWIELYNPGTEDIDLAGYYLSDDPGDLRRWRFPEGKIRAGAYLLVWASGKDTVDDEGRLHANFRISRHGEPVILTRPGGETIVDFMPETPIPADVSFGRLPDGASSWVYLSRPTPERPNAPPGHAFLLAPPLFSVPSGFVEDPLHVAITHPDPGVRIYYTLDGSIPDPDNPIRTFLVMQDYPHGPKTTWETTTRRYAAPLSFRSEDVPDNKQQYINTTVIHGLVHPAPDLPRALVLRAAAHDPATGRTSSTAGATFFLNQDLFPTPRLPVISIISDPEGLFGFDDGILVPGRRYSEHWRDAPLPPLPPEIVDDYVHRRIPPPRDQLIERMNAPANFTQRGIAWERPAFLEYFPPGSQAPALSQSIGIRTQGFSSRHLPCKSLRLYAGGRYGQKLIPNVFFPNRFTQASGKAVAGFRRLILRNSGQDGTNLDEYHDTDTMMRDALSQGIVAHFPGVEHQAYLPAIIFLNGSYWGMLNVRERYDHHYFNIHYDISPKDLVVLGNIHRNEKVYYGNEDDLRSYLELGDYVASKDLSIPEHYEYMERHVDMQSLTFYTIGNLFLTHSYWPCRGSNDIRWWRKRTEPGTDDSRAGHDGRWRWIWKDMDKSFTRHDQNMYRQLETSESVFTKLITALWGNDAYRAFFLNMLADHFNTTFARERLHAFIDEIHGRIAGEQQRHALRWNSGDGDPTLFRAFADARHEIFLQQTLNFFGLPGTTAITLDSNPAMGHVRINTIDILGQTPGIAESPYPWTGVYFQGVPVELEAIPAPGHVFTGWSGLPENTPRKTVQAFHADAVRIEAGFEKNP